MYDIGVNLEFLQIALSKYLILSWFQKIVFTENLCSDNCEVCSIDSPLLTNL